MLFSSRYMGFIHDLSLLSFEETLVGQLVFKISKAKQKNVQTIRITIIEYFAQNRNILLWAAEELILL